MRTQFKEQAWYQLPFIRICLALIAGILLGDIFLFSTIVVAYTMLFAAIALLLFNVLPTKKKYSYQWLAGLLIHLLFTAIGILLIEIHQPKKIAQLQAPLLVRVLEPITYTPKTAKTLGLTQNGKIILYFRRSNQPDNGTVNKLSNEAGNKLANQSSNQIQFIQPGTQLILRKAPDTITATSNPGGFNFKQYAAAQKIYYQTYLQPNDFIIVGKESLGWRYQFIETIKTYVLKTLNQYIAGNQTAAVAEALLIGYKKNLDKELLQAYSSTGVVHIIAISGLHLGMIYGLLLFLMKPFKRIRYFHWIKPIVLLVVIWIFTLLTGASPSILRSAVMFTFIILGEQQGRTAPIYNSLAASAACVLLYNPLLLWDIGFQLSYAAVASIASFSIPITKQLYIQNKLLRTCWELSAVTMAAQILTLPLLLFYFHQFPNLFLFTNFIAVPLSGIILYAEIILVTVAPIHSLATLAGKITGILIQWMNQLIENASHIPFAVTHFIQINLFQTICLYCCIIAISHWLFKKKTSSLLIGIFCFGLFTCMDAISKISAAHQQKLIVYYLPKTTAIDLFEGQTHHYLGNPTVYNNPLWVNNYLNPTRTKYRAAIPNEKPIQLQAPQLLVGAAKKVFILRSSKNLPLQPYPDSVHAVVITGNPSIHMSEIVQVVKTNQLVFDCSNAMWKIERWKKEAEHLHLRHHSVPQEGAFVFDLSK
ncbi:MAG: competence protein [Chitinophagaceae bacterium]|nr:MAG: competence protein [Chitinophagaceae bacterium]